MTGNRQDPSDAKWYFFWELQDEGVESDDSLFPQARKRGLLAKMIRDHLDPRSKSPFVLECLQALGKLRDPSFASLAVELLERNPDTETELAAVWAVAGALGPSAAPILKRAFEKSQEPAVKDEILQSLPKTGAFNPDARSILTSYERRALAPGAERLDDAVLLGRVLVDYYRVTKDPALFDVISSSILRDPTGSAAAAAFVENLASEIAERNLKEFKSTLQSCLASQEGRNRDRITRHIQKLD